MSQKRTKQESSGSKPTKRSRQSNTPQSLLHSLNDDHFDWMIQKAEDIWIAQTQNNQQKKAKKRWSKAIIKLEKMFIGSPLQSVEVLEWLVMLIRKLSNLEQEPRVRLQFLQQQREAIQTTRQNQQQVSQSALTEVQLKLIERLQRKVLKDTHMLRVMNERIEQRDRDVFRVIQSMVTGRPYEIREHYVSEWNRMFARFEELFVQGYTAEDFFRGIDPQTLELFNLLENTHLDNVIGSIRPLVEQKFQILEKKFLSNIRELAKEGMNLDEFLSVVKYNQPLVGVWQIEFDPPFTHEEIQLYKTIYAKRPDMREKIHEVFIVDSEWRLAQILRRISKMELAGIDFTGFLQGLDAQALEWFEPIRNQPGVYATIRQAFDDARQELITSILGVAQDVASNNPNSTYEQFIEGELFGDDELNQAFQLLFSVISQFPNFSSIEKQLKAIFHAS